MIYPRELRFNGVLRSSDTLSCKAEVHSSRARTLFSGPRRTKLVREPLVGLPVRVTPSERVREMAHDASTFRAYRIEAGEDGRPEGRMTTIALSDLNEGELIVRVAYSNLFFFNDLAAT